MNGKTHRNTSKKLLIAGMIGCILFVIGDFLYAATAKGQTTESIGMFVKLAYLEMPTWRMAASILCGFVGTLLYYMGFHRMYGLLKDRADRLGDEKNRKWVRLFRAAYVTGTVAWVWVHAMFMTLALIFKFVYQAYGDVQTAENCDNELLRIYSVDLPDVIAVRNELLPEGGRVENIISGGKRFDECAKWHI